MPLRAHERHLRQVAARLKLPLSRVKALDAHLMPVGFDEHGDRIYDAARVDAYVEQQRRRTEATATLHATFAALDAAGLHVSSADFCAAVRAGDAPGYKVGPGLYRYDVGAVLAWARARRATTSSDTPTHSASGDRE